MRLELTGRHVEITPDLRKQVEKKLAKLDRLATGLKRLSVAPAALGRIKLAIAEADPDHG